MEDFKFLRFFFKEKNEVDKLYFKKTKFYDIRFLEVDRDIVDVSLLKSIVIPYPNLIENGYFFAQGIKYHENVVELSSMSEEFKSKQKDNLNLETTCSVDDGIKKFKQEFDDDDFGSEDSVYSEKTNHKDCCISGNDCVVSFCCEIKKKLNGKWVEIQTTDDFIEKFLPEKDEVPFFVEKLVQKRTEIKTIDINEILNLAKFNKKKLDSFFKNVIGEEKVEILIIVEVDLIPKIKTFKGYSLEIFKEIKINRNIKQVVITKVKDIKDVYLRWKNLNNWGKLFRNLTKELKNPLDSLKYQNASKEMGKLRERFNIADTVTLRRVFDNEKHKIVLLHSSKKIGNRLFSGYEVSSFYY